MIGEKIEELIHQKVYEVLTKSKNVEFPQDIIETDNIGEVIEKLAIIHCRMWYLEDAIGVSKSDQEIADLKRKIDICFKVKRPRYVEAINKMIDKSIIDGKSLQEDSVKLYKGFDTEKKEGLKCTVHQTNPADIEWIKKKRLEEHDDRLSRELEENIGYVDMMKKKDDISWDGMIMG